MLRLALAILALGASIPPMNARPLIVGHRGSPNAAPENTLPSFQLAWQQGADAIEGDFHLTSDRQIVCIHDADTARFRGPKLTVRKTRLETLQALDAGSWKFPHFSGTRVPTFAEVLATVPPGKKFFIEIKSSPKILRHLYREIDQSGIDPSQLVVISFSPRVIRQIKQQRPEITANWLTSIRYRKKGNALEPTPAQILATLRRVNADGLGIKGHPDVDAPFLAPILDAGFDLHVWTINTLEDAQRWTALGAKSITTNFPGLLHESL